MSAKQELPEQLVGTWRIARTMGTGGQGVVYELESLSQPSQRAALKRLKKSSEYHVERMQREIEALGRVQHPSVVRLLAHGADPAPWYVMPLGVPLQGYWHAQRDALGPSALFDRSLAIVRCLLDGLAIVHKTGLVHRDIKPANIIMLGEDETPVLIDFGIVHVPDRDRITDRPAVNKFAPYVPAIYDPAEASPSIDCYMLANLWAWMIARDPEVAYGRYHWRWHAFIEDERSELVRTVLALCGEPGFAPSDAAAMRQLVEDELAVPRMANQVDGSDIAAAVMAQSRARAQSMLNSVESANQLSVLSQRLSPRIRAVYEAAQELAAELKSNGLDIHVTDPRPGTVEAALRTARSSDGRVVYFEVVCGGTSTERFGVEFVFGWPSKPHPNGSLCSFSIVFQHVSELDAEFKRPNRRTYFVDADGSVRDDSINDGGPLDPPTVVGLLRNALCNPKVWLPKTRTSNQ